MPTNKISDVFKYYTSLLTEIYEVRESKAVMYQLISYFFSYDKIDFVKKPDFRLSESELLKIHFAVKELLSNKPLQYILGETDFLGLKIKVNPHVLIPRPETEELVQLICKLEDTHTIKSGILDIGCGSGCIGIALKKFYDKVDVYGLDVSEEALEVARGNAVLNDVGLNFIKTNILDKTGWIELGRYQIIVSNPPYVRDSEKKLMNKNVLEFEPKNALFVPDSNPLLFYRKIAQFCEDHLLEEGVLYFEINEAFGKETKEMLNKLSFKSIQIIQDLNGKDRFIRALK